MSGSRACGGQGSVRFDSSRVSVGTSGSSLSAKILNWDCLISRSELSNRAKTTARAPEGSRSLSVRFVGRSEMRAAA